MIKHFNCVKYFFLFCLVISQAGCTIQYFDKETRTHHLWGFGHMKMRVPDPAENVQAVAQETEILGFGISKGEDKFSIVGGWHEQIKLNIIDEDASVRLEWPKADLFSVNAGSKPPLLQEKE
jgi:hypothetical protein